MRVVRTFLPDNQLYRAVVKLPMNKTKMIVIVRANSALVLAKRPGRNHIEFLYVLAVVAIFRGLDKILDTEQVQQ